MMWEVPKVWWKRGAAGVLGGAVLAAGVATVVVSAATGFGVINACANTNSGAVRILLPPNTTCKSSETPLSWYSIDVTATIDALNAEVARALGAEATLTTNLNNESTRAQGTEATLNANLTNETARAQAVEMTLTNDLNTEAVAR